MIAATAKKIKANESKLESWFADKAQGLRMPLTASVDIRNAGFKIAVIDTNVFPAGFNNLCRNFSKRTGELFRNYFQHIKPSAKKILIIPETFTRNLPYLENLKRLEVILKQADFQAAFGFLKDLPHDPLEITLASGTLKLEKLRSSKNKLRVSSMEPDVILLNNDCTEGVPPILENIAQPIFPSPKLGWHSRRKKHHFEIYCSLISEWAAILQQDCWRFCPITTCEHEVDVNNPQDMERVAKRVEEVLSKTARQYQKHGLSEKPYVFVKSNSGTFGLGQIHVESPQDILNLNRKARKNLLSSKGERQSSEFIIQEGVMTIDRFEEAPIEPVLYYVGGELAGGFFRIHGSKDDRASLNTPGALFKTLCFHKDKEAVSKEIDLHCTDHNDFFEIAKWLGRIAALSVALEEKGL